MGILPEFEGNAVHDRSPPWANNSQKTQLSEADIEHFLCDAHHLRELQYVLAPTGQGWAFHLSLLLASIHSQVKALKAQGKTALPDEDLASLTARYDVILDQGLKQNPMPLPDPAKT